MSDYMAQRAILLFAIDKICIAPYEATYTPQQSAEQESARRARSKAQQDAICARALIYDAAITFTDMAARASARDTLYWRA